MRALVSGLCVLLLTGCSLVTDPAYAFSLPELSSTPSRGLLLQSARPLDRSRFVLEADQAARLSAWFTDLGPPRAGESFGHYVVRAALLMSGRPYALPGPGDGGENLKLELDHFECVSIVESSLALGRCAWLDNPSERCFIAEVARFRYRGGTFGGYSDRLHYFADWLADNDQRGRIRLQSGLPGTLPTRRSIHYMSAHRNRYDGLRDELTLVRMREHEARLSAQNMPFLPAAAAKDAGAELQTGDIVAIVGTLPGILVNHVGFVVREADGRLRLLHASSLAGRVGLTRGTLEDYLAARPERIGIVTARPLPPAESGSVERLAGR